MIDIQKGRHGAIYEIKLLFFTKWFFLYSNCHMIETVSIYRPPQENANWLKNVVLTKNCHFLSNFDETWPK